MGRSDGPLFGAGRRIQMFNKPAAGMPQQNHGSYRVHLRGIFVLCIAEGLATGACVATLSPLEGLGTIPLATTVNGQMLTSVEAIEAAAGAGLVTLLDTGAALIGTISGK